MEIKLENDETLLTRRIEEDGKVNLVVSKADPNGGSEDIIRNAGQLKLVNFQSPQYLRRAGNGFYSNGGPGQDFGGLLANFLPASGSNGKIKQYTLGTLQRDLTNEFANMISHQRSFQAGSVITTSDMIFSEAVNLKR